jgi:hypothetical protein
MRDEFIKHAINPSLVFHCYDINTRTHARDSGSMNLIVLNNACTYALHATRWNFSLLRERESVPLLMVIIKLGYHQLAAHFDSTHARSSLSITVSPTRSRVTDLQHEINFKYRARLENIHLDIITPRTTHTHTCN